MAERAAPKSLIEPAEAYQDAQWWSTCSMQTSSGTMVNRSADRRNHRGKDIL